jgi:HIP---CoA ligase
VLDQEDRHPLVAHGAEDLGQAARLQLVEPRRGAAADDIVAWCRDQMANYKVPRVVRVVDALPVNATGKVVKDELRALAAGG